MPTDLTTVTIYTDGAASPNPGPGGYGVLLIRNGQRHELSDGFRKTTNNRMEILAAIVGLRALAGVKSKVTIYSDSKYVVDMFMGGYAATWKRNNWHRTRKDRALNPDLWDALLTESAFHEVHFTWIRGHATTPENIRCDELAVQARQAPALPPDTGYENPQAPPTPQQPSLFDWPGDK